MGIQFRRSITNEKQVIGGAAQETHSLGCTPGGSRVEACVFQEPFQSDKDIFVKVDNENAIAVSVHSLPDAITANCLGPITLNLLEAIKQLQRQSV